MGKYGEYISIAQHDILLAGHVEGFKQRIADLELQVAQEKEAAKAAHDAWCVQQGEIEELERQLAKSIAQEQCKQGQIDNLIKQANEDRLQFVELNGKYQAAGIRVIMTSDYEQAVKCCEEREETIKILNQQLAAAQEKLRESVPLKFDAKY